MKYAVVFAHGPSSVGAIVPDLPGRVAVARIINEARTLIGRPYVEWKTAKPTSLTPLSQGIGTAFRYGHV